MISFRTLRAKYLLLLKFTVILSIVCILSQVWISYHPRKNLKAPPPYNISNLNYIIESRACDGIAPYLIVVVPSHPNHTTSRIMLRKIYNQNFRQGLVRVVFMFGNMTDNDKQIEIRNESLQYGDIIQGDFVDSYKSISHLHLAGINWVTTSCPQASFVMECDDDIFVNIKQVLSNLEKLGNGTYMYCDPIHGAYPSRSSYSRYCVTEEEYIESSYPTYCNGWSVVYPVHVAHKLIKVVPTVPFLWMSDVYVSGMLVSKIDSFKFISMRPNYTWEVDHLNEWMKDGVKEVDKYLVGPTWGNNDMLMNLHEMVGTFN